MPSAQHDECQFLPTANSTPAHRPTLFAKTRTREAHGDFQGGFTAASAEHGRFVWKRFAVCFMLGFCVSADICAVEIFDKFQIHGFASQVMFSTSHNNMFGHSEEAPSFDFTELGLNGSWFPLPKLRFSMQVLSRRAGAGHNGSPEIDFGLMDYSPIETDAYRLGLRGGRVRLPYGIYNDTRDVAFTRPSILLPQSIYFERTRDLTLSADGGLLYGESRNTWGNVTLEMGGVVLRANDDIDNKLAVLGRNGAGHLDSDLSFVGRLNYELNDGSMRLAVSSVDTAINYIPQSYIDPLLPGKFLFTPVIFSAQYSTEDLTFTSEYAIRPIKKHGFAASQNLDIVGESYYFQVAYRLADHWEIMARYDNLTSNRNDPNGQKIQASTFGAVPAYTQFAKDWTVGMRYDISSWMMVRAEYHKVNGTGWLPPQDNPVRAEQIQHWDMLAVLVSLRF